MTDEEDEKMSNLEDRVLELEKATKALCNFLATQIADAEYLLRTIRK